MSGYGGAAGGKAVPPAGKPGLLNLDGASLVFDTLIGTGGIGWGSFFLLEGDHTLGREESRSGTLLDRRDYCKLHILCHYVKALIGPGFRVLPIGRVGDDEAGLRLLQEMEEAGLCLRYVRTSKGRRTLYSFCLLYPDGSGGNLTVGDSASAEVSAAYVARAEEAFTRAGRRGLALAVPEVPLQAREELLELGTRHGLFRAAGFSSAEIPAVCRSELLDRVDLLALNRDEARIAAGIDSEAASPQAIAEAALERFTRRHPRLLLSITAGAAGSFCWDGRELLHVPALPVTVAGSAGAGDAHLAGILSGLAAGLPLAGAHRLGALLAATSVTCPHTIHKEITRRTLADLALRGGFEEETLLRLLT